LNAYIAELWADVRLCPCPERVKLRRTHCEQMSSGLPLKADIAQCSRHVSKVPTAVMRLRLARARCLQLGADLLHTMTELDDIVLPAVDVAHVITPQRLGIETEALEQRHSQKIARNRTASSPSAALDGARQLGRVWNPQSRPSKFRGAVSLDILCIRQCNAVLASRVLRKRRIKFWRTPPMNRVTIVIRASASRSRTIDQTGN
jgi:hypothetical protein